MSLWMRRLWIQLTSDRRRVAALGGCLIVGLLLWARIIIVSKLPRTAVADDVVKAPSNGATSGNNSSRGTDNRAGDGGSRTSRQVIPIELSTTAEHDPFVISPQYFPKPTPPPDLVTSADKSGAEQADEAAQVEAHRIAQLQAQLLKLRLEACLGQNLAVINGKSYRRGEDIVGQGGENVSLVLAEVRQRSVILESEGRRFELKMASP